MAPIVDDDFSERLTKRLVWWGSYNNDGNSNWYNWGRWVLLGIIVGLAALFLIALQVASCRRVRQGQHAIPGTSWMVPPSYYASQQEYQQDYSLPTYKPEPGEGDAGRYDNGQFIPNTNTNDEHSAYNSYAPPPGPPPGSGSGYQPPEGPPPSHNAAANYHQPPPGPPPGHESDVQAPPPAVYKN